MHDSLWWVGSWYLFLVERKACCCWISASWTGMWIIACNVFFHAYICVTAAPDLFCSPRSRSVTLGEHVQGSSTKSVTRCHHCRPFWLLQNVASQSVIPGRLQSICALLEWDILHFICTLWCSVIGVKAVWRYKES